MPIAACLLIFLAGGSSQKKKPDSTPQSKVPTCGHAIECQKAARAAFDAETARIGKDCLDVTNQRDDNICLDKAAAATERNFAGFYSALEGIVGSAGLRDSQQAWADYRKKQCDAIFDFWRAGTIAPSASLRCDIELTRSRMRDLEGLYDVPLHH